jgi:hypothetical protein
VKKCSNKNQCYEAIYSYDKFGRRENPVPETKTSHLILLGGSFIFGEGLDITQTLGHKIQGNSSYHVFNYAKSAMGTPLALRLLTSGKIKKEVVQDHGYAFYFLTDFHIARESITTQRPWSWQTPAYIMNDQGDLVAGGTQAQSIGWKFYFYNLYNSLREYSYFLRYLGLEFSPTTLSEKAIIMAKTLKAAESTYEKQFYGQFYIVGHPLSPPSDEMISQLKKHGLKYLSFGKIVDSREDFFLCECDQHPNESLNDLLAKQLLRFIKAKK